MKNTVFRQDVLPSGKKVTFYDLTGWHFFKAQSLVNQDLIKKRKDDPDAQFESVEVLKYLIELSVLVDGSRINVEYLEQMNINDVFYINEVIGIQCSNLSVF